MAGCTHVEMDRDATATPRDLRQSPVRILSVVKPTFPSLERRRDSVVTVTVCGDVVTAVVT
jgi:hypothetical protein